MTQFRLLKQTRQMTEYSCGASALQSVLSYWGRDIEEEAMMRLLGTNSEVGTFPEDMVRGAQALGFDAEMKADASLDELQAYTADGRPAIALAQLWRSEKDTPAAADDEWDCGHYIVILSVDNDHVYFQDPYIRMGKGFVPRSTFEAHWHQIMGGTKAAKSPKLARVAIFVSGKEPVSQASADSSAEKLDLGQMGSMNIVSVHFHRYLLPFDFLDELRSFDEVGVRADAFVMLRKDGEGLVSGMQGGRVGGALEVTQVNALIAALAARAVGGSMDVRASAQAAAQAAAAGDFGLSAEDLKRRADRLSPNCSEVIVLLENMWERRLKEIAQRHHGRVAQQRMVQRAELEELGREISGRRPQ